MKHAGLLLLILALNGCATTYQSTSLTGGFGETRLEPDIWRISFSGNGYTTKETVQTYWLYRCAELALQQGYEGFEILSRIQLSQQLKPDTFFAERSPYARTGGGYVYIPMYIPESYKPAIEADIRLLKGPIDARPPVIFDARELKQALAPIVTAEKKCDMGNVCPHVHKYLHPEGAFDKPGI